MMLKLVCLSLVVVAVVGQTNNMMQAMLMSRMMQGGASGGASGASTGSATNVGGAAGAAAGGMMGGMMGMMNNPLLLCRQTENFTPIPCQNWRNICNIVSLRTYNFPNLMSCSPMGVGCCIKDAMSLMFVNRLG